MSLQPYMDVDTFKASLSINDDFADDDLDAIVTAASDAVTKAMGRRFDRDLADVARRYSALDPHCLTIRDLASLTTLKTDEDGDGTFEVTWGSDDYVLQPINAAADDEPFTQIEVNYLTGDHRFPTNVQGGVEITGRWGWPAIPAGVVEATTFIANQLFKRKREQTYPIIAVGEEAMRLVQHDPHVAICLDGLARPKVRET